MMIQTLVENAIWHGLSPSPKAAALTVKAECTGKLVVSGPTPVCLARAHRRHRWRVGQHPRTAAAVYGSRLSLTVAENWRRQFIVTVTVPLPIEWFGAATFSQLVIMVTPVLRRRLALLSSSSSPAHRLQARARSMPCSLHQVDTTDSAGAREVHVVVGVAARVGVALDLEAQVRQLAVVQRARDGVERIARIGGELRRVGHEGDQHRGAARLLACGRSAGAMPRLRGPLGRRLDKPARNASTMAAR